MTRWYCDGVQERHVNVFLNYKKIIDLIVKVLSGCVQAALTLVTNNYYFLVGRIAVLCT